MTPQDFPAEPLRALSFDLATLTLDEHRRAREAAGAYEAAGGYEAALAFAKAGRMAHQAFLEVMAALEQPQDVKDDPHPWPIEGLENYGGLHDAHSLLDHARRFPAWGIDARMGVEDTLVTVARSAHPDQVILRMSTGRSGHRAGAPERDVSAWIDIEQWRALNQLVERIAAGQSIPYNRAGDLPPTGEHVADPS